MSDVDLMQPGLWPTAEFEPCPPDQPCENCGHRMMGHFRETKDYYAVGCHECPCERWCCRHGGMRT